jgi:hypothetical protein
MEKTIKAPPLEQRFIPLKNLLERIQKQAFAKTPGPGQEVILPLVDHPESVGRFIHIHIPTLDDVAERLYPNRQFFRHSFGL